MRTMLAIATMLVLPALAQAQSSCYQGQGPILRCYEGNRPVTVRAAFTYKHDGQRYAWDTQMNRYCYRNQYGNPHCMETGQATAMTCVKNGDQLTCW